MERLGLWLACATLVSGVGLGCSAATDTDTGQNPGRGTVAGPATPGVMNPPASSPGTTTMPATTPPVNNNPAVSNPSAAGSGGSTAMMPSTMGNAGAPAMMPMGNTMDPAPGVMTAGDCQLHTKYAGDEYCILPPPPDKGFQLHIGPSDYDNPEPQYILGPGQETTVDLPAVSTNDKDRTSTIARSASAPARITTSSPAAAAATSVSASASRTSNNNAVDDPPDGQSSRRRTWTSAS